MLDGKHSSLVREACRELDGSRKSRKYHSRVEKVSFTYGSRFGASTVFATARITDITVQSFDSVTPEDLRRIGYDWVDRSCEEFAAEYTRWFAKELEKNYPVAWVSFEVIG